MTSICNNLRTKIFALLTQSSVYHLFHIPIHKFLPINLDMIIICSWLVLGDRNAILAFVATQLPAIKNVQLEYNLLDNKTGNNIQLTTYSLIVS
jgi:hypothetical protein